MSNVFSNTSFAVLSIMDVTSSTDNTYIGSSVFIQRKPENDYGNITILTFESGSSYNLDRLDFNVQSRFEANAVPVLHSRLSDDWDGDVVLSNSNISVNSYRADGSLIT